MSSHFQTASVLFGLIGFVATDTAQDGTRYESALR